MSPSNSIDQILLAYNTHEKLKINSSKMKML